MTAQEAAALAQKRRPIIEEQERRALIKRKKAELVWIKEQIQEAAERGHEHLQYHIWVNDGKWIKYDETKRWLEDNGFLLVEYYVSRYYEKTQDVYWGEAAEDVKRRKNTKQPEPRRKPWYKKIFA